MTVFISYRRSDSGYVTDRIYDYLIAECDHDRVFRDLESISLGTNFRQAIADALSQCKVMLAIIGPQWLSTQSENGQRRLDDPKDFVRLEIETALSRGVPVIPVLIEGGDVPNKRLVPSGLSLLSDQQAIVVRRGHDFANDMERLTTFLRERGYLTAIRHDPEDDHPFGLLGGF